MSQKKFQIVYHQSKAEIVYRDSDGVLQPVIETKYANVAERCLPVIEKCFLDREDI